MKLKKDKKAHEEQPMALDEIVAHAQKTGSIDWNTFHLQDFITLSQMRSGVISNREIIDYMHGKKKPDFEKLLFVDTLLSNIDPAHREYAKKDLLMMAENERSYTYDTMIEYVAQVRFGTINHNQRTKLVKQIEKKQKKKLKKLKKKLYKKRKKVYLGSTGKTRVLGRTFNAVVGVTALAVAGGALGLGIHKSNHYAHKADEAKSAISSYYDDLGSQFTTAGGKQALATPTVEYKSLERIVNKKDFTHNGTYVKLTKNVEAKKLFNKARAMRDTIRYRAQKPEELKKILLTKISAYELVQKQFPNSVSAFEAQRQIITLKYNNRSVFSKDEIKTEIDEYVRTYAKTDRLSTDKLVNDVARRLLQIHGAQSVVTQFELWENDLKETPVAYEMAYLRGMLYSHADTSRITSTYQHDGASVIRFHGDFYGNTGVKQDYAKALKAFTLSAGFSEAHTARALGEIGIIQYTQKNYPSAGAHLMDSYDMLKGKRGVGTSFRPWVEYYYAESLIELGRLDEADKMYRIAENDGIGTHAESKARKARDKIESQKRQIRNKEDAQRKKELEYILR